VGRFETTSVAMDAILLLFTLLKEGNDETIGIGILSPQLTRTAGW
jgi:hypothetical protein